MNIIKLIGYALAGWTPGGQRHCVMCDHNVWRFMPYRAGAKVPLMAALSIVGSDIDHFECPRCGSHDRERHLLLYMRAFGLLAILPSLRVLHFAPERHLSRRIAALAPVQYITCDLYPGSADVLRVDIEQMPFEDGSFDLVIANHVLEHVSDDDKAISEVSRVLRLGGWAVLQTPYSDMLETTWSDPGIATEAARLQAYGQEDHVRLFGRDIFEQFSRHGLSAKVSTHAELPEAGQYKRLGVNPREPFFLFVRGA